MSAYGDLVYADEQSQLAAEERYNDDLNEVRSRISGAAAVRKAVLCSRWSGCLP